MLCSQLQTVSYDASTPEKSSSQGITSTELKLGSAIPGTPEKPLNYFLATNTNDFVQFTKLSH